jgi:hypothetical protein
VHVHLPTGLPETRSPRQGWTTKEKAVDFLKRLGYIYQRNCLILYIKKESTVRAVLRVFPGTQDMVAQVFFVGNVSEAIFLDQYIELFI